MIQSNAASSSLWNINISPFHNRRLMLSSQTPLETRQISWVPLLPQRGVRSTHGNSNHTYHCRNRPPHSGYCCKGCNVPALAGNYPAHCGRHHVDFAVRTQPCVTQDRNHMRESAGPVHAHRSCAFSRAPDLYTNPSRGTSSMASKTVRVNWAVEAVPPTSRVPEPLRSAASKANCRCRRRGGVARGGRASWLRTTSGLPDWPGPSRQCPARIRAPVRRGTGKRRSGLRLALGANPMEPVTALPRSERMSPNRLDATMTSKRPGLEDQMRGERVHQFGGERHIGVLGRGFRHHFVPERHGVDDAVALGCRGQLARPARMRAGRRSGRPGRCPSG